MKMVELVRGRLNPKPRRDVIQTYVSRTEPLDSAVMFEGTDAPPEEFYGELLALLRKHNVEEIHAVDSKNALHCAGCGSRSPMYRLIGS